LQSLIEDANKPNQVTEASLLKIRIFLENGGKHFTAETMVTGNDYHQQEIASAVFRLPETITISRKQHSQFLDYRKRLPTAGNSFGSF